MSPDGGEKTKKIAMTKNDNIINKLGTMSQIGKETGQCVLDLSIECKNKNLRKKLLDFSIELNAMANKIAIIREKILDASKK